MMRALIRLVPFLALAGSVSLTPRQDEEATNDAGIPYRHLRRRAMQSVVTLGDYAYFNGGEMSNFINGVKSPGLASLPLNDTLYLPLTSSWSLDDIPLTNTNHGSPPMSVNQFALWSDSEGEKVYRWGGAVARNGVMDIDNMVVWVWTPDGDGGGSWGVDEVANMDTFNTITGTLAGASASCDEKGFWIGGSGRMSTDPFLADVELEEEFPVPGILTYDMSSREWRNDSTAPMAPPYGSLIYGRAQCVEGFDAGPLVLALGGRITAPDDVKDRDTAPMDNVTFWDPSTHTWHWQRTTGEVPRGRERSCLAGVRGNNTYEIFMYGGNTLDGESNGDIYILSLPGFHWFRVDIDSPPRVHHSCTAIGNRQVLSSGGFTQEWRWEEPDPWMYGIGVFDMTDLEWRTDYDADADPYEPSSMIQEWYDGGNLDDVEWSSDEVRALFLGGSGNNGGGNGGGDADEDDEDTISIPTGSPEPNSDGGGASSNAGPIAGGVVGGVCAIALVGLLIWYLRRRRNRQAPRASELDAGNPMMASPTDGSPMSQHGSPMSQHGSPMSQQAQPALAAALAKPLPTPTPDTSEHSPRAQSTPSEMATNGHERYELPPDNNARVELPG